MPDMMRASDGRSIRAAGALGLLVLLAGGCGGGGSGANSGTGPSLPTVDAPALGQHEFRMSYVVGPDTTRIQYHGYPVWCGSAAGCVRLSGGFPPLPGLPPQIHISRVPSHDGPTFGDDGYIIFHPNILGVGTWLPAQCRGQCLTFDFTLGATYVLPPLTVRPPPKLVLSALPDSMVLTITTAAADRVTLNFVGAFVRSLNGGTRVDTVHVADGYIDARTFP